MKKCQNYASTKCSFPVWNQEMEVNRKESTLTALQFWSNLQSRFALRIFLKVSIFFTMHSLPHCILAADYG